MEEAVRALHEACATFAEAFLEALRIPALVAWIARRMERP